MNYPLVTIQLVVWNGERYIRDCLRAVKAQTYPNLEVVILDNHSDDRTASIVATEYPNYRLIRSDHNRGMWPGHEYLLPQTSGKYILALSVDVIIDTHFIEQCVAACEREPAVAAVQGKIYQIPDRARIDTCGFAMTRSRKVVNSGHGMLDGTAYANQHDIFGVEGAVPFFRRNALEDCRLPAQAGDQGSIWDPDYFWYGDDLDLAWRMTLFGHRQIFLPSAIAWHDRATTKGAASVPILGQLKRLALRRAILLKKRRLDWINTRFTIIKNDAIMNILKDLPWIFLREVGVCGYAILFEPGIFVALGRFVRLLSRMLRRRREVLSRARITPQQMRTWFI